MQWLSLSDGVLHHDAFISTSIDAIAFVS